MATKNACPNSPNFLTTPKSKPSKINFYKNFIISHATYIFIIPAIFSTLLHHLSIPNYLNQKSIAHLYNHANLHLNNLIITLVFLSTMSILLAVMYVSTMILRSKRRVYLMDFSCYKHDPSFSVSKETFYERLSGVLSPESLAFTQRAIERTGVSDTTFLYGINDFPPKSLFACAREEAEVVICGAVDDLMAKTGVDPREIGVVIVNISTFNPVPSLSAMIVNRYKLREDVLSYNLGGMGCSAGIIAVDLAKRRLQVEKGNTYALIMSLECVTSGYYMGDERSKLLSNCLFRMGGAAVLLSNSPSHRRSAKYELTHTVRTHLGADDRAYKCVLQEPDKHDNLAISLTKDLMAVAGDALKANITALAPLVLPPSEKLRFLKTLIARKVFKRMGVAPYVPDFSTAFDHFCVHAGGKAVLDAVEKNLNLYEWDMEPSRMTLHRYCNTSSSSLWYELAYLEAKGRIRKGDRVWQVGFGSGFKCGSGVWRALRTISPNEENNPWSEVIDEYPVYINRD